MAKLTTELKYHLHYSPPSLDDSVNQFYEDKELLLKELKDVVESLLCDDCDLRIEDNNMDYLPIEITLRVLDKPSSESYKIYTQM